MDLLEWAQASSAAATNRVMLPHLIVVLNQSDDDSEWDSATTTAQVLDEQSRILKENGKIVELKDKFKKLSIPIDTLEDILKMSYSSVRFIRLLRGTSCIRLSTQLEELHSLIREASLDAQRQKSKKRMLLDSRTMNSFYQLAFDHYSNRLHEPFDFLEKLLAIKPLPSTFSNNLYLLMRTAFQPPGVLVPTRNLAGIPALAKDSAANSAERIAQNFCKAVTPVISSAMALDIARSFGSLPCDMIDIFKGRTAQSTDPWNIAENSYEAQISEAFKRLMEENLQCEFRDEDGRKCVNARMSHLVVHNHQDSSGVVIGGGAFESSLHDELVRVWDDVLSSSLSDLMRITEQSVVSPSAKDMTRASQAAIWSIHRENLDHLFSSIPELEVSNLPTCFWCFRHDPTEILPCGHGVCPDSLVNICDRNPTEPDPRIIRCSSCNLHGVPRDFGQPPSYLVLPQHVGRRILTLDGGGVRGLIELRILAAVEKRLGGKIPIQAFFDLVGGTSAGGLLAIGLQLKGWRVKEALKNFKSIVVRAFTRHSGWRPLQLVRQLVTVGAVYKSDTFEEALKKTLGDIGKEPIMGQRVSSSRLAPTSYIGTYLVV